MSDQRKKIYKHGQVITYRISRDDEDIARLLNETSLSPSELIRTAIRTMMNPNQDTFVKHDSSVEGELQKVKQEIEELRALYHNLLDKFDRIQSQLQNGAFTKDEHAAGSDVNHESNDMADMESIKEALDDLMDF